MSETFLLQDFDFSVPRHLIAQHPSMDRSQSRILLDQPFRSDSFTHFIDTLSDDALIIYNTTQVFPARFQISTPKGAIEFTLLHRPSHSLLSDKSCERDHTSSTQVLAFTRPQKYIDQDCFYHLTDSIRFHVSLHTVGHPNQYRLCFDCSPSELEDSLAQVGQMPLPPYIKRSLFESEDHDRYKTVYGTTVGSVATPTAGLHFTQTLIDKMMSRGILWKPVLLHVGCGTFLPVRSSDLTQHVMHKERYFIPKSTYEAICHQKSQNKPIIYVGTTTLRALESFYRLQTHKEEGLKPHVDAFHDTDLFIYPKNPNDRYQPKDVDGLITNFHQPQSTLFMLISALIGRNQALETYDFAVNNNFRFFSYGDACFLSLSSQSCFKS